MKPKSIVRLKHPEFADVRKWFDENLDAEACDLDDQEVYENVYHAGKWAGVFQFTEGGAQRFAQRARPRSIVDIAAITSIYRPGPLAANVDKLYVSAKEKVERGEQLEYDHPIVEKVLSETYGYQIFQESFMLLGRELGKLSWEDCDKLRKILVKKSIGQDVNDEKARQAEVIRVKFVEGAVANGMSEVKANELWETMKAFNGYGFNKTFAKYEKINIYTQEGIFRCVKQVSHIIPNEDYVKCHDEKSGDDVIAKVLDLHDHGKLPVYEYTFDDGSKVTCTENHKFRTTCGQMLPIKTIIALNLSVVQSVQEKKVNNTKKRV
jgi:DNA polymerase-3 subunit alpha